MTTPTLIVTVCMAIALGITTAVAWPRVREHRAAKRLHDQICADHGLSPAEASWLWNIATQPHLDDPLLVFVQPSILAAAAENTSTSDGASAVHLKLFGVDL